MAEHPSISGQQWAELYFPQRNSLLIHYHDYMLCTVQQALQDAFQAAVLSDIEPGYCIEHHIVETSRTAARAAIEKLQLSLREIEAAMAHTHPFTDDAMRYPLLPSAVSAPPGCYIRFAKATEQVEAASTRAKRTRDVDRPARKTPRRPGHLTPKQERVGKK